MTSIKWLPRSVPVIIALVLGVAIVNTTAIAPSGATELHGKENLSSSQKEMQLAQSNPPPPPTNPGSSSAGGRRDPSNCPQDAGLAAANPLLTALSPTPKSGLTLAERPTFLVYVPKTSAKTAEFSLRSRTGQGVYRTMIALTTTPNLIGITLPAQAMPLEVGKLYTWSFAIICNPNDRLDDRFVTGMIQRRELDATRLRQIQQAPPRTQVALYQQADVWYDAIAVMYQLKRSQRNDPGISTAWRELLQAGGIDTMIDSNAGNGTP
jgi:hypothetical protein